MDWFHFILRAFASGWVSLFGGLHPLVGLTVVSILAGVGMLWVFKKTSNQKEITVTRKRMQARLLELRLYGDDPRQLWSSQVALLKDNLRYIAFMLKPAIYLIPPLAVLLVHLDFIYGLAPLPVGRRTVLTVQAAGRISTRTLAPDLTVPPGVAIETPAVRSVSDGRFSWGLAATQDGASKIDVAFGGKHVAKEIVAGGGGAYVSPRRVSSIMSSFVYPGESLLDMDELAWIEIDYPARSIGLGGFELHWLIWFFVISMAAGYLLKGAFGVSL